MGFWYQKAKGLQPRNGASVVEGELIDESFAPLDIS